MLKREQAQELLKNQQVEGWQTRFLDRIAALPPSGCNIGYALLERDEQGKPISTDGQDYYKRTERQNWGLEQLTTITSEERLSIFGAFFPGFAPQVEQGWQLLARLPYQVGWQRKAFRAPDLPEAQHLARAAWLKSFLVQLNYLYFNEKDIIWLAQWVSHFASYGSQPWGILFAATIEAGGELAQTVFDILCASARGDHPIGAMGRHVTTALLVASRLDGWEFIEKLLLAAQREEGLRQVILETVDEAHPEAFRRMVRLILEHDLIRFSATVRAVDVWFNFGWDAENSKAVGQTLSQLLNLLEDPQARQVAIESQDGQTIYLSLWTTAFENASAAIPLAAELLQTAGLEQRYAAVYLLGQLNLPQTQPHLLFALQDSDLRVATTAYHALQSQSVATLVGTDFFERLQKLLIRTNQSNPEPKPLVWPWPLPQLSPETITRSLLDCLGDRPIQCLLPYLNQMDHWTKVAVAERLAETIPWEETTRQLILALAADRSQWVRERALQILGKRTLSEQEAVPLEGLLTRKSSDLRRGVLSLLLNQPDEASLSSASRLLSVTNNAQRQAGWDLLYQLLQTGREVDRVREQALRYQEVGSKAGEEEKQLLKRLLEGVEEKPTLKNVLGLIRLEELAKSVVPCPHKVVINTDAAHACLIALDELIETHCTTPVKIETWQGTQEMLLGNLSYYQFPTSKFDLPLEEDLARLPLCEVWQNWWENRPAKLRDPDKLELVRTLMMLLALPQSFQFAETEVNDMEESNQALTKKPQLHYSHLVGSVLRWLLRMSPQEGAVKMLLDSVEQTLAAIPAENLTKVDRFDQILWRNNSQLGGYLAILDYYKNCHPTHWDASATLRLWQLYHWIDRPVTAQGEYPEVPRQRPALELVLEAYLVGGANEADGLDQLVGTPWRSRYGYGGRVAGMGDWHALTSRKTPVLFEKYPVLEKLVPKLKARVLEVELARGELPTAATQLALSLRWSGGLEIFVKVLRALGNDNFVRGYSYDNQSKATAFSHLLRVTFPAPTDTQEEFVQQLKVAGISNRRLIEAAVYAPQWAGYIEQFLAWPRLTEAIWWIHAHTKDVGWTVDAEIRESWIASVSERTPLSTNDLLEGAVDVAWFGRFMAQLGSERWEQVYEAAKYAAGGNGHSRARLFADAMLGRVSQEELMNRLTKKRNQDAVRAIGLLPLTDVANEVPQRYKVIQEFIRTSRQFGAQRRASEGLAARIGLDNLARTAGYPDPLRLQWAMEAELTADLKEGSLSVKVGEVIVSLSLDSRGETELTITKGDKTLKTLPPAVKKNSEITALLERQREIEKQRSRTRLVLEEAMCRGDLFGVSELKELLAHPVLAPLLKNLVFITEEGERVQAVGYPQLDQSGQVGLRSFTDKATELASDTRLRIAHPYDLLLTDEWGRWQQECFLSERIQPFKQIFRELYVLSENEKREGDETTSARYSGHQVQPKQALALLGQRGWISSPEDGVRRTFHQEGISAWLTFQNGIFTPAEVEGLTLEKVFFTQRGEWQPLALSTIEPRVFSEVMRDLDLVVSVAHQGGVDPEASHSTVEMRTVLVRETSLLLRLDNVNLKSSHALIEGKLGSYSVHLGSGVTHRQPGGALCIVPVHSQHRGRLFLPFADSDPKTAEILSKIVLLARDDQIKDPTILEQIL